MISTSCHKNWDSNKYKSVSISGNRGKDANYVGECYPKLAPKLSFWKIWHGNIGVLSPSKNNYYYVEQYYLQVLSKLDPKDVYNDLENSTLLCYEENNLFCHRHIVAFWLELSLCIKVPELKEVNNEIWEVERPKYICEYLTDVMKNNKTLIRKK